MGRTAAQSGAQFVISVGDNFYENGVASATDPQWKSSFEDIYTAPALQVPWYVALGNHDYRGDPQAQIEYGRTSQRWRMPSRYFTLSQPQPQLGSPLVDLFVIDSSPLVHSYRLKMEGAIQRNVASQDVQAQLAWLDGALGRSKAPWKLVIGHHTIHSGGSGHGDTPELVSLIKPLLETHGVQAYINGHDHDLQHIRRGSVDYICTGAGSEVRPVSKVEGTRFAQARSGFSKFDLDAETLRLTFIDYTGAPIYDAAIPRQGR